MKKLIISFNILFTIIVYSATNYACSLIVNEPTRLVPSDYIFVGKVVGYTEEVKPNLTEKKLNELREEYKNEKELEKIIKSIEKNFVSSALIIELDTTIYLPEKTEKRFEVYPLNMDGPCYYSGKIKARIAKVFPIGSRINVVAQKSMMFQKASLSEDLKLETGITHHLSLTQISGNEIDSSLNAKTDYKALFEPQKYLKGYVLQFELQKEYVRMEFGDKKTIFQTLERLIYFPDNLNYYQITKNYLGEDDSGFHRLINLRNKYVEENLNNGKRRSQINGK